LLDEDHPILRINGEHIPAGDGHDRDAVFVAQHIALGVDEHRAGMEALRLGVFSLANLVAATIRPKRPSMLRVIAWMWVGVSSLSGWSGDNERDFEFGLVVWLACSCHDEVLP
jgi:hypothetical protein